MTLEQLICACYTRVAFDPRDSIYALLGLAADTVHLGLRPSYEFHISDAFRKWTERMMTSSRSLRLLSYVNIDAAHQSQDLPSWVPHFGIQSKRTPLSAGWNDGSMYKAGGTDSPVFSIANNILRVKSLVIGHIAAITPCLFSTMCTNQQLGRRPAKDTLDWIKDAEELAYNSMSWQSSTAYLSDASASTAFWRALIGNRCDDGSVPDPHFELQYAMFRKNMTLRLSVRHKSRFEDHSRYCEMLDRFDWPERAIGGGIWALQIPFFPERF